MKVRCPFCKKISKVPGMYRGRCIKCPGCRESFIAEPYKKPPIVVSDKVAPAAFRTGFFITKLWTRSPAAYRTGFLATLGVISALWVTFNLIGPGTWLRRPAVQKTPVPAYDNPQRIKNPYSYEDSIFPHLPPLDQVALILQDFEQVREIPPGKSEAEWEWAIKWRAWVCNPHSYIAHGSYFIEFRDSNGSLLDYVGPIEATFPPTSSNYLKTREASGIYWPSHDVFVNFDPKESRISIRVEK